MSARGRSKKTRRSGRAKKAPRRWLGRLVKLLLVLALVAAAGATAWLWPRCADDGCPSVSALREYTPPQASRVFDREGDIVAHLAAERRIVVPLDSIPAHVVDAFLAVEDRRFYEHPGVDLRRIPGAVVRNVRSRRFEQGFSTITMQLARNVFPEHLTREKTVRRKVWELVLSLEVERELSKDEILELYLNQIYLGDGSYGVEAAARGYFGKSVTRLDAGEAAVLAALPRAPSHYNPRINEDAALSRRNLVLSLMESQGVVEPATAEAARKAPLELAAPYGARGEAAYFVAAVRREVREHFGEESEVAGLQIHTTLDRAMQRSAERRLREQIEAIEAGRYGAYPHGACNGESACLQGLFVALESATGEVRALVGGRDFASSQFDRVHHARRQSGSAFKPFVYATALTSGVPVTTALLGPGAARSEGGYRPADHVSDESRVDLREGMRLSSNRAAVALGEQVGVGRVVQTARTMGISTPMHEYPSTFLGAADVVPLEMVAAYAAFSTEGRVPEPRLITRVLDADGNTLLETKPVRTQALAPGPAYLTLNLMEDVVSRGTGSGVRSALPGRVPAAGKTGTTNDAADVWFVGVTPDMVGGVWLGFDQPRRIMHGASGGRLAAPLWGRIMADAYEGRPAAGSWLMPPDVKAVRVNRNSGMLPTSECPEEEVATELFLSGTEPTEYCHLHPEHGIEGWFRRARRTVEGWLGGS